jgi:excisionase family DNA binding protein
MELKMNKFLNMQETADTIKVSKATLYSYTHKRMIPYVKLGKKVVFYEKDIENWMQSRRIDERKIK